MSDTGRGKITFRISTKVLEEIDDLVRGSDEYNTRSDFIRGLIMRGKRAPLVFNSSSILLHNNTFKEVLNSLKDEDVEKVTKKTSTIVHSFMQDRTKSPIGSIKEGEALASLKEIYESTNMVKKLHYTKEDHNVTICLSGDNLCSSTFSTFLRSEIMNVMKPWLKLKSSSETPGNLVLVFE